MIEKIKNVLSKQLRMPVEEIENDANIMEDLGADSLDIVEMLMTLEDQFNVSIPDEDVTSLKTVRDIAEYLETNIEA
ncbi:MAG: acyl carrier protein [Clostridiales bacterium GWF2_38_85]|nr:MAG: acyl carrier protein [Clostridiales bacterium GWF2_38_85]